VVNSTVLIALSDIEQRNGDKGMVTRMFSNTEMLPGEGAGVSVVRFCPCKSVFIRVYPWLKNLCVLCVFLRQITPGRMAGKSIPTRNNHAKT
jgi:hypothetical protein